MTVVYTQSIPSPTRGQSSTAKPCTGGAGRAIISPAAASESKSAVAAGCGQHAVAVIDPQEVVHAAVQSWCWQAKPRISFISGHFSVADFLDQHPNRMTSTVTVVICDIQTNRGQTDFAAIETLVGAGYRVIVHTHTESDGVVMNSVERGAITCVLKLEGKEHLMNAIRAAQSETPYVGPRLARAMLSDRIIRRPQLAPREREVLIAWFRTDSKDAAARQLSIAPTTVRTMLQRIRAKYTAAGRPAATKAALVARAIQDGIIGIEDL